MQVVNMKKYWRVVKNQWEEILTYRLNFIMWRVRNVLQLLAIYFLWFAIVTQNGGAFGYSTSLLLTYIFGGYILQSFIFATRTQTIGVDITRGDLLNYLVRPLNYFNFYIAKDIGDKIMNLLFSFGEIGLLIFLLRPSLFLQRDPWYLLAFFISILVAIVLFFILSLLLSLIGFWSEDIWSARFLFMILLSFFAGAYFPLDILPQPLFSLFQALPFTYLLYFPLKIYLGQVSFMQIALGLSLAGIWVVALLFLTKIVWAKGLRSYAAYGR